MFRASIVSCGVSLCSLTSLASAAPTSQPVERHEETTVIRPLVAPTPPAYMPSALSPTAPPSAPYFTDEFSDSAPLGYGQPANEQYQPPYPPYPPYAPTSPYANPFAAYESRYAPYSYGWYPGDVFVFVDVDRFHHRDRHRHYSGVDPIRGRGQSFGHPAASTVDRRPLQHSRTVNEAGRGSSGRAQSGRSGNRH